METRKITIISSANQNTTEIMTNATTLGELKAAMSSYGIPSKGMTFLEGRSKTELLNDAAILPTNVPGRDGNPTNELVFLVTNPHKEIKSGMDKTRTECYDFIINNDLKKDFSSMYGKSFTNATNLELNDFVANSTVTKEDKDSTTNKVKELLREALALLDTPEEEENLMKLFDDCL